MAALNGSWVSNTGSTTGSVSVSHTLNAGNGNRVVLACVMIEHSGSAARWRGIQPNTNSSATVQDHVARNDATNDMHLTYGGVAMNHLFSVNDNTDNIGMGWFYLLEADLPANGSNSLAWASDDTTDFVAIAVGCYDDVLQIEPLWQGGNADDKGDQIDTDYYTAVANSILVNSVLSSQATTVSQDDSQTERVEFSSTIGGAISDLTVTGTGGSFVGNTWASGTSTLDIVWGNIVLVPDTATDTDAQAVMMLDYPTYELRSTASSADVSLADTLSAGSDRIVLAWIYWDDGQSHTIATATYGGQTMTSLGQLGNTTSDVYINWFYILEANLPSDGANTLAITIPSNLDNIVAGCFTLENVKQQAPVVVQKTDNTTSGSAITHTWTIPSNNATAFTVLGCNNDPNDFITSTGAQMLLHAGSADAAESFMLSRHNILSTTNTESRAPIYMRQQANGHIKSAYTIEVEPKTAQTITLGLEDITPTFYAPQIDQTLTMGLEDVSPTFYAPQVDQTLTLGFEDITPTFYAPQVDQTLTLGLEDNSPEYFTHTVTAGAVVTLPLEDIAPTFYAPQVNQTLTLGLEDVAPTYYAPQINQTVTLGLEDVSPVFFALTVVGDQTITLALEDVSPTFYAPQVNQTLTLGFEDIAPTFYSPQIDQTITLGLEDIAPTYYAPQVDQTVALGFEDVSPTFYSPQVDQTITLGLLDVTPTLYAPQVNMGISLALEDVAPVFYSPTVTTGAVVQTITLGYFQVTPKFFEFYITGFVPVAQSTEAFTQVTQSSYDFTEVVPSTYEFTRIK